MRLFAATAFMLLSILLLAFFLPRFYTQTFEKKIEKTHLFYSPVNKKFIYTEKIIGPPPQQAYAKAEDHHVEIAYRGQDKQWYTRVEFEKLLPFIYYKNMELWGLLPVVIDGTAFTKAMIKKDRQVFEIKSGSIPGRSPEIPLWPLLESEPGRARLVFPVERFRLTPNGVEFINADYNRVDTKLSEHYTRALQEAGCQFPVRSVHGRFTLLKPFDEGIFLVDKNYQVFHLKKIKNRPVIKKLPLDVAIKTRYIQVIENKLRQFYGLLLDEQNRVYLLACDKYRLIHIPLDNYNPKNMDFKLIMNPLYYTATYSDDHTIYAVVLDKNFHIKARYRHAMSKGTTTIVKQIADIIFPFRFTLNAPAGEYLRVQVHFGSLLSLVGIGICLLILLAWNIGVRKRTPHPGAILAVLFSGVYGLIAASVIDLHDC